MARRGVGDSAPAAQLLGTFRVQMGGHTLHPGQGRRGKGRALGLAGRSAEQRRERGAGREVGPARAGRGSFSGGQGTARQAGVHRRWNAGGAEGSRESPGASAAPGRGRGRKARAAPQPSAAPGVDSVRGPP